MVFLCKLHSGQKVALKRMFVNSESNLEVCKQEIRIWVGSQLLRLLIALQPYHTFSSAVSNRETPSMHIVSNLHSHSAFLI